MRALLVALVLVVPVAGLRLPAQAPAPELIERTLALVGGQAITLGDVRAALALGLVDATPGADAVSAATLQLVDRELVLREVQRYAPPTPGDAAVDARLDELRQRLPPSSSLPAVLDRHGFTAVRLRAWVRDDLRAQAYLAQRFASASAPGDTDIAAAYERQRAAFDQQGLTFEQAAPIVRDRLVAARQRELIADWVAELRRRTDVVILPAQ